MAYGPVDKKLSTKFEYKVGRLLEKLGVHEFLPQKSYSNAKFYEILELVSKNYLYFEAELKTHKRLNESLIIKF